LTFVTSLFSLSPQARYRIHRICEFYGATEGNVNMYNSTGRAGALGYMPVILTELFYPVK